MISPRFTTVGAVAKVDSGPAFRSKEFREPGQGIPLLRGDNIEPGSLRWARTKTWPAEQLGGYEHLLIHNGDLILGMDRPIISSGLKLARATQADLPALLVQRVARIRPTDIDGRYLYHWLSSREFIRHLKGNSTGTQLPHVTLASIRSFRVPRFNGNDERRIVEILEDHLSRLDAAAAMLVVATQRLRRLQERLVMDAITGTEHAGERSKSRLADVGTNDGELPDLPSGWSWSRLGEVADVVGGVTKDANKQANPDFVDVPYLRVANVQRGLLDLSQVTRIRVSPSKAEALRLQPGDVLLNEGGDRDKLARGWVWEGQIEHCIHQNHVFRARIRDPRLDPYFLSWTANTIGGRWAERNGKQSVNLASISLSMVRRMPVIVPISGHAAAAVAQLHERLGWLTRLRAEITEAEIRNAMLRRSLLDAAFSGSLPLRDGLMPIGEELVGV